MTGDIPGQLGGSNPLATWLNRLRRAVTRRTILQGVGYKVRCTEEGTLLEIIPGAGGTGTPVAISQFQITNIRSDHLVCRTWNGAALGTTDVIVAKPYKLRGSITSQVLDEVTVDYTYFGSEFLEREAIIRGEWIETQIILPRYLSKLNLPLHSNLIVAAKPTGGT